MSSADRCVPGKRLRNRRYGQGQALRAFVCGVAAGLATASGVVFGADGARVAKLWLASKAVRQ